MINLSPQKQYIFPYFENDQIIRTGELVGALTTTTEGEAIKAVRVEERCISHFPSHCTDNPPTKYIAFSEEPLPPPQKVVRSEISLFDGTINGEINKMYLRGSCGVRRY